MPRISYGTGFTLSVFISDSIREICETADCVELERFGKSLIPDQISSIQALILLTGAIS